ncbi:MAG: hypothetical protein H0U84_02040 [Thermoleophilaceae bacterium]|nr:hypothetical protein [Thermoleophilaceae bacterium]
MTDEKKQDEVEEGTLPETSLHAYKEGREDEVDGDVEKLKSSDPEDAQRKEMSGDPEETFHEHDKH